MVLPAVAYLLKSPAHSDMPDRDPDFALLPRPGTAEGDDLLRRIYAVMDAWAASPKATLEDAVYIEFVESGYAQLTVDDLMRFAGPVMRQMAPAVRTSDRLRRWIGRRR